MTQTIVLGGLRWTVESEEPLPPKFGVFLENRLWSPEAAGESAGLGSPETAGESAGVRSPERGGNSPAQGEALGTAKEKIQSPEGAGQQSPVAPLQGANINATDHPGLRPGLGYAAPSALRSPDPRHENVTALRSPDPVLRADPDQAIPLSPVSCPLSPVLRADPDQAIPLSPVSCPLSPVLRVLPDLSLVGEPAPWDPTITHEDGIVRYRGQEVSAEGRLPLDEFVVRAAPHSLGAERALLGWMVTRMTYRGEGIFLHSASIRAKNGAWLLIGGPGVGKSTACRLAGDRSLCTNVTCLREVDGRWLAYPTAFTGQPDPPPPERGPFPLLGAIVLRKGETVGTIEPMTGTAARTAAIARSIVAHYPSIPACTNYLVGALASLVAACPVYTLSFRRDAISLPD